MIVDDPRACNGSGQVAAFATHGDALPCPVCGRTVRAWRVMLTWQPAEHGGPTHAVLIETHAPPIAGDAPTLSLNL